MSQAELHFAAEAEEDRLLAERADAEVSAIHELQRLESDERAIRSNISGDDSAAQVQPLLTPIQAQAGIVPVDSAPTSYVSAGLSFAIDCLGDEWAPADESTQQRQERHLKRAGIVKIMDLDNQLCAVRQRHRIITRTFASANGQAVSLDKRRAASSSRSTLFSEKDQRLHQRLQRAAEMCKNAEAPQLVRCILL